MSDVGEQWCPICQEPMEYDETDQVYRCPTCSYEIDELDADIFGLGYPTLESTNTYQDEALEQTFEEYYKSHPPRDEANDPDFYED